MVRLSMYIESLKNDTTQVSHGTNEVSYDTNQVSFDTNQVSFQPACSLRAIGRSRTRTGQTLPCPEPPLKSSSAPPVSTDKSEMKKSKPKKNTAVPFKILSGSSCVYM